MDRTDRASIDWIFTTLILKGRLVFFDFRLILQFQMQPFHRPLRDYFVSHLLADVHR